MKWLLRSFIMLAVGLCVTTALFIGPVSERLSALTLLPDGVAGLEFGNKSREVSRNTSPLVAAMHARNEAELQDTVGQINGEFGIGVTVGQFSSHHVARDYLERLRLAEQARAIGFIVDPQAFGDDQFMRRHVEALRRGGESAAQALLDGPVTGDKVALPGGRDCIFIYGHKYYRDTDGRYVRADGTPLQTSLLNPPQRGRMAPPSPESNEPPLAVGELPSDLDALLDMLAPAQSKGR